MTKRTKMDEINKAVKRFKIGCFIVVVLVVGFSFCIATGLITRRWFHFDFGRFRLKESWTVLGFTYSSTISPTQMTRLADRIGRKEQPFTLLAWHWGFIQPKIATLEIVVLADMVGYAVAADEQEGHRWSEEALSQLCHQFESLFRRFLREFKTMDLSAESKKLFLAIRKWAGIKGKAHGWWLGDE